MFFYAPQAGVDFNRRFHTAVDDLATALGRAAEGALAGVILCGGYGRGEGAAIRDERGDEWAWNDVDLLPIAKAGRKRAVQAAIQRIEAARRQFEADFAAELDIGRVMDERDIARLKPVLLWLETARGHRVFAGPQDLLSRRLVFSPREHPAVVEAHKLLLNRGTGLVLAAAARAGKAPASFDCSDRFFVTRNVAKAALAVGDALLMAAGVYRTAVVEKPAALVEAQTWLAGVAGPAAGDRAQPVGPSGGAAAGDVLRPSARSAGIAERYYRALQFKTAPLSVEIATDEAALAEQAKDWLAALLIAEFVRSGARRHLESTIALGVRAFADEPAVVEPTEHRLGRPLLRNLVINVRRGRLSWRYPRETLFRRLPLMVLDVAEGRLPSADALERFIALWQRFN